MYDGNELISSTLVEQEAESENILRPQTLEGYIGQDKVKENLMVYISAARRRNENLDHVLLYGPPGLGKTTLAHIIANEMHTRITVTSGPAIEKAADLVALLSKLTENEVLFIDEIHRYSKTQQDALLPHLENGCKDKQFSRFCQIFFYKSTVLEAGLEPAEPFTCPATLSLQLAWSQN